MTPVQILQERFKRLNNHLDFINNEIKVAQEREDALYAEQKTIILDLFSLQEAIKILTPPEENEDGVDIPGSEEGQANIQEPV
jgi:hypothetical protein